ncbi:MAG TPA: hypothetical protein VKD23_00290 [Terriglobales bacterium]|nr:hypothetical protein [Terriglobales bacterium]
MGILLEDMDQLRVVRLSDDLEEKIIKQVQKAKTHFEESESAFNRAAGVLLKALDLINWQPPSRLTYVRRFSDVRASTRMDAEHYREEFYAATRRLKEAGAIRFIPVDELLNMLTNGHTPLHHDLEVGNVPFLCAEHVSNFEVHYDTDKRILLEQHQLELARTALHNRDVLLTIKGRVGNAAMVENLPGPANINQDVALLRLNNRLPAWFVLAFVNSLFGQLQVRQLSTGGINPFLGLSNVRQLQIPEFEPKLMDQIAKNTEVLVKSARSDRQQAYSLLAMATRTVDLAVEQGEKAALAYCSGREE